jgi:hypothetical protein
MEGRLREAELGPCRDSAHPGCSLRRRPRGAINHFVAAHKRDPKPFSGELILALLSPPPIRECIQDMAQGRGDTGDDGNKSAKRHNHAEQHERAQSGLVGNQGGREPPHGDCGKGAQQKPKQAPPTGALRILEGANGDPSRRREEDQHQHEFEHIAAFDKLREA